MGTLPSTLCNVMLLELPQDNQKVRLGGGGHKEMKQQWSQLGDKNK
jgi:hypothetical protein